MIKSTLQWGGYLRNTNGCGSNEGHWNQKHLVCAKCNENFDENWKLEKHLISHGKAKEFKCDNCEMSFHLK